MACLQVKGIRRTSGTYEGNSFDNTYLHCLAPADRNTLTGQLVEIVKVSTYNFNAICDRLGVGINDLQDVSLRVYYNKYGNVDDFDIVK